MKKRVLAIFLCLITLLSMFPVSAGAEAAAPEILQQPENCRAAEGEEISITVVAAGEGLTYQWFFSDADEQFQDTGVTTDTYTDVMTAQMDGRKLYCVITDQNGASIQSDTVTLHLPKLEITRQPENVSALRDESISVIVAATGDGLTYQWYFSDAGADFQRAESTTDTYTATMTETTDGRKVYCVITDRYGNTVQSDTVTLELSKPRIVEQPKSSSAYIGKKVSVTVVATGDGLKYQWYFCNPGKTKFSKSSITSKTYSATMSKSRDGRKVYCVITDKNGYSVKTDTVTIRITKPTIQEQPQNSSAHLGKRVSTTVMATGDGITYQWYFCNAGSSKFSKSGITAKTYQANMTNSRDGRKVYCVITDKHGYSVKTDTVTLRVIKPEITQQPQNCYAQIGETVSTSVEATGSNLTYQWYFRNSGSKKFSKASIKGNTYQVAMSDSRNGRQIYCVITDQYGASVTSKTVTLKVPEYAKITKQPKNTAVDLNTNGGCSVSAKGDGITYQWYLSDDGGNTFSKSSITTASYTLKMVPKKSGRLVYCVVTDRYGNSVQSDTAKLVARGSFTLNQYSLKVGASRNLAKELGFSTDDTLKWKSSNSSAVSVTDTGVVTRHKKGTVTITVTGVNTGITASCKVKVPGTKQVALTFDDGPSTHTARLLDYLETTDAKVTFFMVGNRMNSYKASVKRMAKQGHELGYHSWDHYNQTKRSSSQISSEFKKANKILKDLTGQEFTVWRTPGGAFNDRVLDCVPVPHIFWSSSTQDWRTRNATKVYNAILDQAKDGAIILLHDLHGTTVDGAIRAMKKLEKEGYEFVTVTELLSRNGKPPKPSTNYYKG